MHHALLAGGPDRLTTAGTLGLPQVLCPGRDRGAGLQRAGDRAGSNTAAAGWSATARRSPISGSTREEMAEVGREVGRRVCRRPSDDAVFLIPTAGYDSYATEGEAFFDPEADAAFVAALRARRARTHRASSSGTSTSTTRPSPPRRRRR